MRRSRIAGLLLVSLATLAQQSQPVEITSEPRHHLVLENQYVRVFDVTVEPKGTTLVHRHNHDYLFVTLGDSDITSVRPGEQPVHLVVKDGETRFTPGNFAHAAINNSDKPFHNITIELLQPSTNVKTCEQNSSSCAGGANALLTADQWTAVVRERNPGHAHFDPTVTGPALAVLVSGGPPGQLKWADDSQELTIAPAQHAGDKYVVLQFRSSKP